MRTAMTLLLVMLAVLVSTWLRAADDYQYYSQALQGDLSDAESRLNASSRTEDQELLKKFRARFVERTDGLELAAVDDAMVSSTAIAYQQYWRDALLRPNEQSNVEDAFLRQLVMIVADHVEDSESVEVENVLDRVEAEIRRRGYYVLGGRTPPLLELMLWRVNEDKLERIALVDGVHEVPVTYAIDFVTRGWSHFATFGRSSTGGWATPDGLFCVTDSYDTDSENFTVSFLQHEGRHFVDYRLYPSLPSADLEYRAKLTELAFATNSTDTLLLRFSRNVARNVNSPHAFANWHVVEGLRGLTGVSKDESHSAWWAYVPSAEIAAAARQLLEQHDRALKEAGGAETTGVLGQ